MPPKKAKQLKINIEELEWCQRNLIRLRAHIQKKAKRDQDTSTAILIVGLANKMEFVVPGPLSLTRKELRFLEGTLGPIIEGLEQKTIPKYSEAINRGEALQDYKQRAEQTLEMQKDFLAKIKGAL